MRKKQQAETAVAAKRASKRSRAGAAVATAVDEAAAVAAVENPFASTKKDGTSSMWKAEALDKLIDLLQREGFDGDYGELNRNHLPQFGEGTIRLFFNKLSRWKEPTETATAGEGGRAAATTSSSRARAAAKQQEATIDKIKSQQRKRNEEQSNEAPIEEWIGLVQDKVDVLRMNNTVSLLFEWIAEFETHPEPSQCCGVDYASIYQYLAALMEGQVPRQLDPPSASKLLQMFQQVTKTISQSAAKSHELLAKTAKAPPPNVPVRPEIKNKVLRERRRAEWNEEELNEAQVVKGDDLDAIKELYCSKSGLNPFAFPSTI